MEGINSVSLSKDSKQRLHRIRSLLCQVPTGQKMLSWLDDQGINIHIVETMPGCDGMAPKKMPLGMVPFNGGEIYLNAHESDVRLAIVLAHEARHVWQHDQLANGCNHPFGSGMLSRFVDNPWAYSIMARFIEADAASMEYMMIQELINHTGLDYGVQHMKLGDSVVAGLVKFGLGASDTTPKAVQRKYVFDRFFQNDRCMKYDEHYVQNTVRGALFNIFRGLDRRLTPDVLRRDHALMEQDILKLGRCAWGEQDKVNYLSDTKGGFDMNSHYTGGFSKRLKRRFNALALNPGCRGLNTYVRQNGKKQKLIS